MPLRPALEHLVKGIVDHPDDVRVRMVDSRRGKRLEVRVHPTMIPASSPMAAVSGVFNAVFITGDNVGNLMFYGRGAGQLPTELTRDVKFAFPGSPAGGGSDYASFLCHGAPGFSLGSLSWDYGAYTWHTNRDTFDKIVIDDLENNAVLTAMLVYLASEDPQFTPRDRRVMPVSAQTGQQTVWPECTKAARSIGESTR